MCTTYNCTYIKYAGQSLKYKKDIWKRSGKDCRYYILFTYLYSIIKKQFPDQQLCTISVLCHGLRDKCKLTAEKNDRTVILQKIIKLIKSRRISNRDENVFTKTQNYTAENRYNMQAGVGK